MSTNKEKMLPTRLQQLRKSKQFSQKQIANAMGISEAMYCRIENGERTIKDKQLEKISNLFKTDIEELQILCLADKIEANTQKYPKEITEKAFKILNNEQFEF